jgi:hypothetical protein
MLKAKKLDDSLYVHTRSIALATIAKLLHGGLIRMLCRKNDITVTILGPLTRLTSRTKATRSKEQPVSVLTDSPVVFKAKDGIILLSCSQKYYLSMTEATGADQAKAFWLASDFDDPLEVALVYNKVEDRRCSSEEGKCGHALRWDPLIRSLESRERSNCPICNEPIALVCDGLVASSSSGGAAIQQEDKPKKKPAIVTFKYGKQVYRLSIPPVTTTQPNSDASTTTATSQIGLLLRWTMQFLLPFAQPRDNQNNNNPATVQHRIAQAFGMNLEHGLKILNKGKILYPLQPTPATKGADCSTTTLTDLSDCLVKISESDWELSSSIIKKPSLVVMGTRSGKEEFGRNPTTSSSDLTSIARNLVGTFVVLPFRILHFSISFVLQFVGSIVQPLLPTSTTTTSTQQRPHQD